MNEKEQTEKLNKSDFNSEVNMEYFNYFYNKDNITNFRDQILSKIDNKKSPH